MNMNLNGMTYCEVCQAELFINKVLEQDYKYSLAGLAHPYYTKEQIKKFEEVLEQLHEKELALDAAMNF